jgi:uncharacterized protein (TIGR00255 family)
VDVYINISASDQGMRRVVLDKELAQAYDLRLKELSDFLGNSHRNDNEFRSESCSETYAETYAEKHAETYSETYSETHAETFTTHIEYLASCPDVLRVEAPTADIEALWPFLEEAANQAAGQFSRMREIEGRVLAQDLAGKVSELRSCRDTIAERAPGVIVDYKARLESRLRQLLDDMTDNETFMSDPRVVQEIALMADRLSIDEELVRFGSHLDQVGDTLSGDEAAGRKLDFLVQEMNRELNTIGAKASDLVIAGCVVDAKGFVENLKEQVQNLE